jgi:amidase
MFRMTGELQSDDGGDLAFLDATAQAELVRRGDISPSDLVTAAIVRIEALDPVLGAMVSTRFERALDEAAATRPDGPFRGVPLVVKDAVQHSEGDRYQHGMRFLRDRPWRSPADTELVRRFRAAGFVVLGRSKVPELTMSPTTEPLAHGPARNPWDPRFTTGGSSGGSAAAVASGMVPVGHANDMGGSIRIPASCCGLVGLKPSRHRTSLAPLYGEYWGPLTHEHVVCRSVRDTAAVLDATAGPAPGDLHMAPPPRRPWADEVGAPTEPLYVGLLTGHPFGGSVHPACAGAAESAARHLEALGHRVEPCGVEPLVDLDGLAGFSTVLATGVAAEVAGWERRLGEPVADLEPANQAAVDRGRAVTGVELVAATDAVATWSRRIVAAYAGYDLLLSPTMPNPPIELGVADPTKPITEQHAVHADMAALALPFDVTGQPALSLPLATGPGGLPIGVQLVAAIGREDLLVRVASALEAAVPWAERRPPARSGRSGG